MNNIDPHLLLVTFRALLDDAERPATTPEDTLRAQSVVNRALVFLDMHGRQLLQLAERGAGVAHPGAKIQDENPG